MSVRGSTGSRRLAKQGQTAGHAGEEAESLGSGRGSSPAGHPQPPSAPTTRLPSWLCRERLGGGRPRAGAEEVSLRRVLLTPREQSRSESSHLGGSARLASGPLAAGGWTTTSWQRAPLAALSSLTPGNGAGVRRVMRGSSKDSIMFSNRDHPSPSLE